jgi:hypothetical protein
MPAVVDTPHFAYPFTLVGNAVDVSEQDSIDELQDCANVIVRCPTGFLLARPDFGWAFPEFRTVPIDPRELVAAMNRFGPTATFSAVEVSRVADLSIRTITLNMQQVAQ